MKICLLGVGKMGSWLAMQLKDGHQLAVLDIDSAKCQAISGCEVMTDQNQIDAFNPQALIN
jgi:Trk K+ transport system NAD-binding subunit